MRMVQIELVKILTGWPLFASVLIAIMKTGQVGAPMDQVECEMKNAQRMMKPYTKLNDHFQALTNMIMSMYHIQCNN